MENQQNLPLCPQCGNPIPSESPGGHCPRCLFAFAGLTTGASSAGMPPFEAPSIEQVAAGLPHLEILELIGQGGMGCVFKARQPKLGRLVALKVLPPSFAQDPAFAERFEKEARALAALNHPNIVTIHDFGQSGGFYYLLMEYVNGVNLRQVLQSRKLAPREALAVIPPLCDALQFAHDRGIVHRDIKPENLLLDKDGRIKVADFGIAKMLKADGPQGATNDGVAQGETDKEKIAGTPKYMAPEQSKPGEEADHRADIYSLGVVLYEMLTGEVPAGKFEPPSRRVLVDVRFDQIVLQALEKTPQLRFQSATDFRTKVETVLREEAAADSAPRPASTGQPLGQSSCYVSDKKSLASFSGQFFHFRQVRELTLDSNYLTLTGAGQILTIPLKAIKDVSLGHYPRLMNPAGLDLISLTYEEHGQAIQMFLAPFPGSIFGAPARFNLYVEQWLMKIRQAVERAGGKAPTLTPADQIGVPGSSPWLYLIFAAPFLAALGISLNSLTLPSLAESYPYLIAAAGFLLIGLFDLVVRWYFKRRSKPQASFGTGRRIAIGLCGGVIPLLTILAFAGMTRLQSQLETDYQALLSRFAQWQKQLDRELAGAHENKVALQYEAVAQMSKIRDAIDPQKAKPNAKQKAEQLEQNGQMMARKIEQSTGRELETVLNSDRVLQQKFALELAMAPRQSWLGLGAAITAMLLLSALYLLFNQAVPLLVSLVLAASGLGALLTTFLVFQEDWHATRSLLDGATRKAVPELPGIPGRFGPLYAAWAPVTSDVHDDAVACALIAVQPRCLLALRTFVRVGEATTEIPAMAYWTVPSGNDPSPSFQFHWFVSTKNEGERSLVFAEGNGQDVTSANAGLALPKGLVWKAIRPDPMAIGIVGKNQVLSYPIPGPAGFGQLSPKVWNRFPVLIGRSADAKSPAVEVLAQWAIFPLQGDTSAKQQGTGKKLGAPPDSAELGEMKISPDWWKQAMVVDAVSPHTVVATEGQGNPGFYRLTWKIASPTARVAILRFRKEMLKIDMEQDPLTQEYGITLTGEFLKKSSTESYLQWVLQKKVGSWILENWQIPEEMTWKYPEPNDPISGKIWLNHPVDLIRSQSDAVTIELSSQVSSKPNPVRAERPASATLGGLLDLPAPAFPSSATGAPNSPLVGAPPAEVFVTWQTILSDAAEQLQSHAKNNGEIEFTLKRKGESHTWTNTSRFAIDSNPARAALALAASCPQETEGDQATPDAWKKQANGQSYFHATFDPPLQVARRIKPDSEPLKIKELLIPLPEDRQPTGVYLCEEGRVRLLQGFPSTAIAELIKGDDFQLKDLPAYKQLFSNGTDKASGQGNRK